MKRKHPSDRRFDKDSSKCECNECHWWQEGCDPCLLYVNGLGLLALAAPTRPPRDHPTFADRVGMAAIRGYQRWLSPRLPTACRHKPSCSAYGLVAVGRYGLWQGSRLTASRIRRCGRDVPHGTPDPVP